MNGFFGNMFDFNHDGKLDGFERAADFAMFASMMEDEESKTCIPALVDENIILKESYEKNLKLLETSKIRKDAYKK